MSFKPIIYGLVDPLEPNEVRYVGKTRHPQCHPYAHKKDALSTEASSYKINWVLKLLAAGRSYDVITIHQCDENISDEYLSALEIFYIAKYRAEGHRLTNGTDGGEGATHIEAVRQKLRDSWTSERKIKQSKDKREFAAKNFQKMSEANKRSWTPERHKRAGLAQTRRWSNLERREKHGNAIREQSISLDEQLMNLNKRVIAHCNFIQKSSDPDKIDLSFKMIENLKQKIAHFQEESCGS